MTTSCRRLVRESLLAMIVSYLREGIVTPSNFTLHDASMLSNPYPFTQGVWTFSLNSELWQIAIGESGQPPLSPGVTIEFAGDRAAPAKAMPQIWSLDVRFRIRVPWDFHGESTAQEIAQKIDEALYRANGRIEVKDFEADPQSGTGNFLEWQTVERGEWTQEGRGQLTDLQLHMQMKYSTPNL